MKGVHTTFLCKYSFCGVSETQFCVHCILFLICVTYYYIIISLDENLNFVHVGNLQDRAKIFYTFSFKIPPYPLLDMCRKCEEMSCFSKQEI